MIDATYLKAHRPAASMGVNRGRGRLIGRTKGDMKTKLHAVCDSQGRPLNLLVTAGLVSDKISERVMLSSLPNIDWLLGDRGYDADWFRETPQGKGIHPSSRVKSHAPKFCDTINTDTSAVTTLRSCSAD